MGEINSWIKRGKIFITQTMSYKILCFETRPLKKTLYYGKEVVFVKSLASLKIVHKISHHFNFTPSKYIHLIHCSHNLINI